MAREIAVWGIDLGKNSFYPLKAWLPRSIPQSQSVHPEGTTSDGGAPKAESNSAAFMGDGFASIFRRCSA
jgi:hypothetical protein